MKNIMSFVKDRRNAVPVVVVGLSVLLSAILLIVCVVFFFSLDKHGEDDIPVIDNEGYVGIEVLPIEGRSQYEMRGVWVASVSNINFPSETGLGFEELVAEIDDIVLTSQKAGFNAIFFQVRPCSDALYYSEIFPWSQYITGLQGELPDGGFDPFEYLLMRAHENNIEVHAWINPFRITTGSSENPAHDVEALSEKNPARLHPEYTVPYADGKLYYNPGLPEVRKLCVDGVVEILERYPAVDGIHFDDYFYPYPVAGGFFDDTKAYEKYGNGMELGDWRRQNVNSLIRDTYIAIKGINPDCRFGISPFGIWANSSSDTRVEGSDSSGLESYFSLYCDSLAWVEQGIVDYIAPQLYWAFTTSAAPFDNMARWWNAQLDGTGVQLYIGHAAYKALDYPENEIPIQVEFAKNLISYGGSIFYGYADIKNNTAGVMDSISELYRDEPVVRKTVRTGESLKINNPKADSTVDFPTVYLMGSSDPIFPVEYNGKKLSRTKDGFFSIYTELTEGLNIFKLSQNKTEYEYKINKISPIETPITADTFRITKTFPSGEYWATSGEELELMAQAPVGSKVTAQIGDKIKVELSPTIGFSSNAGGGDAIEVYKAKVKIPVSADENSSVELGQLIFTAKKDGKSHKLSVGNVKELAAGASIFAEVINDYTYLKVSPKSSFYNDFTPVNRGMRDYVTGMEEEYYRLKCGGYVHKDDVQITEGQTLVYNTVSAVTAESVVADNSNNLENHTVVRFVISENTPVNLSFTGEAIVVTFFETVNTFVPAATINTNPMVNKITGTLVEGSKVEFTLELKNPMNYYGCNGVYEDGFYVLYINNPQSLADGEKPLSGKTIVVDAGHGGADSGAAGPVASGGGYINESELNLAIALELEKILAELGAKVIMTRTDDSEIVLNDRVEFLSTVIPDMMVSVHHNSVATSVNATKVRGTLALYSHEGGKLLATCLGNSMAQGMNKLKRETSSQKLAVARNHRFPSALCEVCFVSNCEEYQWSISDGNNARAAQAIADGILDFYKTQTEFLQ